MDVEDKEMELLSNSIAAYAHIKGGLVFGGHSMRPVSLISKEMFSFFYCSKPGELRPVLCARRVFRPRADALPPGHPHFM